MDCALCQGQRISHRSCAVCAECLSGVCTPSCPSPIPDYHATQCNCGQCRQTVCTPDKALHAQAKHKRTDPSGCFPDLIRHAVAAIDTGSRLYLHNAGTGEPDPRPTKAGSLSDYLNLVTPGWRALEQRVGLLSPEDYVLEPWPSNIGGNNVKFLPSFLSEAMVDRIVALSFRSLGIAAGRKMDPEHQYFGGFSRAQRDSLKQLAAWAASPVLSNLDDADLRPWIPSGDELDWNSRRTVTRYLARAVSIPLPMDVESIVDMIVPAYAMTV